MGHDTTTIAAITLGVGFVLTALIAIIEVIRHRDTGAWREEFRLLQLENNRHLQKVHDENTRFFRSMGLTVQQIFERVDGGDHGEQR